VEQIIFGEGHDSKIPYARRRWPRKQELALHGQGLVATRASECVLPRHVSHPDPRAPLLSSPPQADLETGRQRHVKCGEERPSCRRCIDTERICDWYPSQSDAKDQPLADRGRGPVPLSGHTAAAGNATDITTYSIPFKVPGSKKDRQKLHYFCVQGAADLAGGLSSVSDFWTVMVLQYSHDIPLVRNALIALSSIHLDFVTADDFTSENIGHLDNGPASFDTLTQYGKAIRQLRRYLTSTEHPCVKTALICSLLFHCFESVRGDYSAALVHLENGLGILRNQREKGLGQAMSGPNDVVSEDLRNLDRQFARMDLQATFVGGAGRFPSVEFTTEDERSGLTPIVATGAFKDLAEAELTLDKLRNQACRFHLTTIPYRHHHPDMVPIPVVEEKTELLRQLENWSVAMDGLWILQHQISPPLHHSEMETFRDIATMLKLSHRTVQMILLAHLPEDETIFTSVPNVRGREILSLIESLRSVDLSRRTYSSEGGVVGPLLVMVAKCSDPGVFTKALTLVASSGRREGPIDGKLIVRAAARLAAAGSGQQQLHQRQPVSQQSYQLALTNLICGPSARQMSPIDDSSSSGGLKQSSDVHPIGGEPIPPYDLEDLDVDALISDILHAENPS
jgi:hypothetical protein